MLSDSNVKPDVSQSRLMMISIPASMVDWIP